MADLLYQQKELDQAYEFLLKALEIHQSNEFLYGISEVNSKLGEVFMAKKSYK